MKQYKFEVVITEGSDEYWDAINKLGKTGCDEILKQIKIAVFDWVYDQENENVKLVEFLSNKKLKQYKFEIIVNEGNDEFWDDINKSGKTGCDDVLEEIRIIFDDLFPNLYSDKNEDDFVYINDRVKLVEFINR